MQVRDQALHDVLEPRVRTLRVDPNSILRDIVDVQVLHWRDRYLRGVHCNGRKCIWKKESAFLVLCLKIDGIGKQRRKWERGLRRMAQQEVIRFTLGYSEISFSDCLSFLESKTQIYI
jgi:hypothetical protein